MNTAGRIFPQNFGMQPAIETSPGQPRYASGESATRFIFSFAILPIPGLAPIKAQLSRKPREVMFWLPKILKKILTHKINQSYLNLFSKFLGHSSTSIVKNSKDNNLSFDGPQQAGQLRTRVRVTVKVEGIDLGAARFFVED